MTDRAAALTAAGPGRYTHGVADDTPAGALLRDERTRRILDAAVHLQSAPRRGGGTLNLSYRF